MLRILSWSPSHGCDKMHQPDFNMLAPKQPASIPDFPLTASVKRKRSLTSDEPRIGFANTVEANLVDAENTHAVTLEPEVADIYQIPSSATESTPCKSPPPAVMDDSQPAESVAQKCSEKKLKSMKQTISAQLSLEILVKHKELRFIDQEIAKCQVALEQLRRCSEIPYPGTQQLSLAVSEGKGAALRRHGEQYPAKSPAPWGVTDGPYSRHYSKWLLSDARFDGGEPDVAQIPNIMDAAVPARSTRGSFVESGKSLKSRSTMRSGNFKSLPAGYGQPKEKATGPMILKRKSDNTMVKLVCPDCGRHDFGSAQGFINHCRIGHSRSFASHDAAAEACGEPVEYDSNGTIKGSEPVTTTPTTSNMHPLIRSAKLLSHSLAKIPACTSVTNPEKRQIQKPQAPPPPPAEFSPSLQTPHLSELVRSQGLGINLHDMVTDAKTQIETQDSDYEGDEMQIDSPLPTNSGRHPQVAGSKQPVKSAPFKKPSPLLHSRMHFGQETGDDGHVSFEQRPRLDLSNEGSRHHFVPGLIPSPTNESTQAPSLVDDDEEFDPQSPPSSDEIDEADVDFDIHDDDHGERAVLRGAELPSPHGTCAPTSPTRTHARQSSTIRKSLGLRGEEKAVNIASPSPHPEGSDRKRRKLGGN